MSDILAEPLFDWFINSLRPSTFSYKEEKSIITAIQSVTIQTYFIWHLGVGSFKDLLSSGRILFLKA